MIPRKLAAFVAAMLLQSDATAKLHEVATAKFFEERAIWESAGFTGVEFKSLQVYAPSDRFDFTHETDLDVVVVRNSGWTEEIIGKRYKKLANVYGKFGLRLNLRLIIVDPPIVEGRIVSSIHPGDLLRTSTGRFGERLPFGASRMMMIHVKELADESTATSGPEWAYKGKKQDLVFKNWISLQVLEPSYNSDILESYSPEAHELGHCLLDSDHVEGKNLMAGKRVSRDDQLTGEQIQKLLTHRLVRVLR